MNKYSDYDKNESHKKWLRKQAKNSEITQSIFIFIIGIFAIYVMAIL